jgi:hypothetical protein
LEVSVSELPPSAVEKPVPDFKKSNTSMSIKTDRRERSLLGSRHEQRRMVLK